MSGPRTLASPPARHTHAHIPQPSHQIEIDSVSVSLYVFAPDDMHIFGACQRLPLHRVGEAARRDRDEDGEIDGDRDRGL